jgi:Flp pilus assembly protein TadD
LERRDEAWFLHPCERHVTTPAQVDPQLLAAVRQGAWAQVLQRAAQILPSRPDDADVHFFAGIAHIESRQLPQAQQHLAEASRLAPHRPDYATQYARALSLDRRMREAVEAADRAMRLQFDHPSMLDTLGVIYSQAHAYQRAVTAFGRAIEMAPAHAPFHFNLGYSLIALGDVEGAERELEKTISLEPRHVHAHVSLAKLRKQTPQKNHIERLRQLLARYGQQLQAQLHLNMALAKELEDTGDYPNAFEHLVKGKQAARRARPYSIKRDQDMFDNVMRAFPVNDADAAAAAGDPSREPIFVMGMPRTGTTLLDRILSSHAQVFSAGELQLFPTATQQLSASPLPILVDPALPARVRGMDWHKLGSTYLASTRSLTGEQPHFIDKMPHNFLYAGFIARALPNAKLICLRRDPLDTCLSNFRHLFEHESSFYDYSTDLLDTGRYYVLFDQLMAHWRKRMPGRILEIDYESLVDAQEASTRRLLDFCELPWDEACLHFENNPGHVSTPNAWQVRSPIYRTAIKHWQNYAPQLSGLMQLLREAGISFAEA